MNRLRASLVVLALVLSASLHAQQAAAPAAAPSLASAPDQEYSADGVSIRYRDIGTGDAVIFIHGYTAALESMITVSNALPANFRKIALDVRGFGKSSKFKDDSKFGQAMVDDVIHLMDQLKIQRAHLVGHSMGALISANVLAKYPERVSTAALVAGPFWDEQQMKTDTKRWTDDLENGVGLQKFFMWLLPNLNEQMAAATSANLMKTNDLGSLIASLRALPRLQLTGLSKNGDRALLIAGTGDPLFPTSGAFAKNSPGAKIVEIQGANHVSVVTHAEAVKAMTAQLTQ